MANIFQEQIEAEKPKAIASERIYVYVPRATANKAGIASYDDTYFRLNAGKVYFRDTNPSERPSLVKIDDKQDGLTYEQDSNGKYVLKGWLKTINNESLFGEDADEPGNIELAALSQMATKTTAGLVYMWEDADGVHIWNTNPQEVNYTVEENEQGGLSVVVKTLNYQIEENQQGGLSVIIGGENE